jgi:hypothetical protein
MFLCVRARLVQMCIQASVNFLESISYMQYIYIYIYATIYNEMAKVYK